jgi:hypothetical protein
MLPKAPSAVCAIEIPSLAFFKEIPKPRIAEVIRVAIAKPAASSFAEFIRNPVDRRSIDCELCNSEALAAFCANKALKFVLMTGMVIPQEWKS